MTVDGQKLSTKELAARWGMTVGALENWREQKKGPPYIKLGEWRGARVLYRLEDVLAYEKKKTIKPRGN